MGFPLKNLLTDLMNLAFPESCPGCGRALAGGEKLVCTACLAALPFFPDQELPANRLGGRLPAAPVRAWLQYQPGGVVQRLLHHCKYRNRPELAFFLGELMGRYFAREPWWQEAHCLVPVPLHKGRQRARGYNQSERLASGMAGVWQLPVANEVVVRVRASRTQTRQGRARRWHNVAGIFEADPAPLEGRKVILVDDVLTTGATLEACGRALLEAGIARLSVVVLAAAV